MRFKDVPVGAMFRMDFGGARDVNFRKATTTTASTKRLNSEGYLTITLKPELNQDECKLVEPEQTKPHRPFRSITDGVEW